MTSPEMHSQSSMDEGPPPLLYARNMTKRFGDFVALEDVSFRLQPGSVHALLGENGAGKSTLVKCIMGFYRPTSGRVVVGDSDAEIKSPRDAQSYGIGMVYQHFTLVDNLSVVENLVLARAHIPAVINWKLETERVAAFMETMPFRVRLAERAGQLAAGEKQKLEILKQLYLGSRIIILDEPTSVLAPQEADNVLGMLHQMARDQRISVAMITHKFREVKAFADEVTVLRRGRLVGGGDAQTLSTDEMATMMVGSAPPSTSVERLPMKANEAVVSIEALEANDDRGRPVLRGITLKVHAGEIVGVAGVSGNGQEELVEVLAGQRPATSGIVRIADTVFSPIRRQIRKLRVRLLPEAPLRNACVGTMSVGENIAFRTFDVSGAGAQRFWLDGKSQVRRAEAAVLEYQIKTPSTRSPIGDLSGGNVQRAVLARELHEDAACLIAANPCFGLDFAAVREIRTRIVAARHGGTAVLLISADLDEIFALSDRIVVISEGRIVHETSAELADLAVIGRHMAGHEEEHSEVDSSLEVKISA